MIRLVLGGDKSGKSAYGLEVFERGEAPRLLLATGQAQDFSFRRQILDHRIVRDPSIAVRETGADLVPALEDAAKAQRSVLVDSLDFWLFACQSAGRDGFVEELVECVKNLPAPMDVTFVSCEAGLGAMPASSAVRAFVRGLGALNQAIAAVSDEVCMMVAGIPLYVKRP